MLACTSILTSIGWYWPVFKPVRNMQILVPVCISVRYEIKNFDMFSFRQSKKLVAQIDLIYSQQTIGATNQWLNENKSKSVNIQNQRELQILSFHANEKIPIAEGQTDVEVPLEELSEPVGFFCDGGIGISSTVITTKRSLAHSLFLFFHRSKDHHWWSQEESQLPVNLVCGSGRGQDQPSCSQSKVKTIAKVQVLGFSLRRSSLRFHARVFYKDHRHHGEKPGSFPFSLLSSPKQGPSLVVPESKLPVNLVCGGGRGQDQPSRLEELEVNYCQGFGARVFSLSIANHLISMEENLA